VGLADARRTPFPKPSGPRSCYLIKFLWLVGRDEANVRVSTPAEMPHGGSSLWKAQCLHETKDGQMMVHAQFGQNGRQRSESLTVRRDRAAKLQLECGRSLLDRCRAASGQRQLSAIDECASRDPS
jgi:hypothetical protein